VSQGIRRVDGTAAVLGQLNVGVRR